MSNTFRKTALAALLGSAVLATAAFAAAPEASDAIAALNAAGYTDVRDLDREEGGLWEAEVRGTDGRWHDVHVIAASGEVLDDHGTRALLGMSEVLALLQGAGYSKVSGLERDAGLWEADATRNDGARVELRIHGYTGAVLSEEFDD